MNYLSEHDCKQLSDLYEEYGDFKGVDDYFYRLIRRDIRWKDQMVEVNASLKEHRKETSGKVLYWTFIIGAALLLLWYFNTADLDSDNDSYNAYIEKCLSNGTSKSKCKEQWKYIINH